jgi:hypothetical protein
MRTFEEALRTMEIDTDQAVTEITPELFDQDDLDVLFAKFGYEYQVSFDWRSECWTYSIWKVDDRDDYIPPLPVYPTKLEAAKAAFIRLTAHLVPESAI